MKVINIDSERFYRQACDYFYFLENSKLSLLCIEKILKITPYHYKTWFLKGEIFLDKNQAESAIGCFENVEKYIKKENIQEIRVRNLANIAVCYEMLEDYKNALIYCNRALEYITEVDYDFLPSLYQLQISSLIKLKRYAKAKKALREFNSYLFSDDVSCLKMSLNNSCGLKLVKNNIAK